MMCRVLITLFALLILLTVGCADPAAPPPADRLVAGEPFPAVTLTSLDGEQVPLEQFRGKMVLLNVWATWCPPCRKELPSLERLQKELDPDRFAVITLSVDEDDHTPREYLIDKGISLTSYIDKEMEIASQLLGITVYPDTLLISQDGIFIRRFIGERVWDEPQMIRALEEAYQGRLEAILRA